MKLISDRSNNVQNQQKSLQNDHKTTSKFTLEKPASQNIQDRHKQQTQKRRATLAKYALKDQQTTKN